MLLNVDVETVGDIGAFFIYGNQFVIPGRYIIFERSVEKEFVEQKHIRFIRKINMRNVAKLTVHRLPGYDD